MGGFPILDRPGTWQWTILDILRERTNGFDYVTGVLESWQQTEADRLGDWTAATLQTLYV